MGSPKSKGWQDFGGASAGTILEIVMDAARYWEPLRVVYNLVLVVVVLTWLILTWPHFRTALTWESLGALVILAVIANALYCVAYVVEISMERSAFRAGWHRWRWMLWLAGTLLAVALAWYWIGDEIYPYAG